MREVLVEFPQRGGSTAAFLTDLKRGFLPREEWNATRA
jgi:hypothetical protein